MIYNDVESVPRCRIVISESTKSQTYQMRWRSVWSEMLTSINPQVAPAHYMLALKNMFETLQTKDEDKESIKVINEMVMMIARLQLTSQAVKFQADAQGSTLQGMQIDMQIQQLMGQLNQQFQQPQPTSHTAPEGQQPVQYPNQNSEANGQPPAAPAAAPIKPEESKMNPSPVEAVSSGMPTPPPLSGGTQ
jgi:L-rhamnose mutarotase